MVWEENKYLNEIQSAQGSQHRLYTFLNTPMDLYAILQLRRTEETANERFMSYDYLKDQKKQPNFYHYNITYVAQLPHYTDLTTMLEDIYEKFNIARPQDFRGYSLSISDIVALKINTVISFHYVDSLGFKKLVDFLPDHYLKNINNCTQNERISVLEYHKEKSLQHKFVSQKLRKKERERE